jgi:hypothetical protein
MGGTPEKSLDDEQRLWAMREYLRVHARPDSPAFEGEVTRAAVRQIEPVIERHAACTGEIIIEAVARQLGVRFEEVRSGADIERLERTYLEEKRELGFGRLTDELSDHSVDALLFQRMHADGDAPDRWVAVLNMTQTQARAYWSRPHELLHRLAEPPQQRLPFYRHRSDAQNRLERIIDSGAAELAFPRAAFGQRVQAITGQDLTWELIQTARIGFAPTASLLSAAKAVLRFWPRPAFLLQASVRGRRGQPNIDVALRVNLEGFSSSAPKSGVQFFPNMRVPPSSPIAQTFTTQRPISDVESLGRWVTTKGSCLPDRRALTSALHMGPVIYGLVVLLP